LLLSPSQRIKLISEISKRLATESWSLIDLTLKQFKLPWTDNWQGEKDSYIVNMTEEASDETLVELGSHLGFELSVSTVSTVEPKFWSKGYFRIFISHLSVYQELAGQIQDALGKFGITAFVAHKDVEPTTEWQNEIETALATADALIALLHPNFHESKWTDQEVGYAMGRAIPTFAVRLGQDPYGFIGRFQAFNGKSKSASGIAQELFEAFLKHKQTQRRMAEILIRLFEKSGSFADAKLYISYLEQLETWDDAFSKRIAEAVDNNSQVRDSFGVPARVTSLIKKWKK
jgi:hypothetical protein